VLSVLLIDNDPSILDMITIISEMIPDISVETARSANDGLKKLKDKSFDAVIVDYDLQGINGFEFLKIIRSKGDTKPVILFTALGLEDRAIETVNNGAIFFLKKGENLQAQFRELITITKRAATQTNLDQSPDTSKRIISEMINFSSDPSFAIDPDGNVVAWNESIEQLTGVPAGSMIGRGGFAYAEPFFGARVKMLIDLVFAPDEEIRQAKYMLISRVPGGMIIAVTRGQKKDGSYWTLWSKANPIYGCHGNIIAVVSTVRDVTTTFGDVPLWENSAEECKPSVSTEVSVTGTVPVKGLIKKMLGRALIHYKDGVNLYVREKNFTGAIAAFDKALAIDERLSYAWNDRGICFRELGDNTNALKSHLRAVELVPDNTEYLFNLGETLELIGVLNNNNKYLDSAIQTFKMVADLLPNNVAVWVHLGNCLTVLGKRDESKTYFDRASEIELGRKDTPIIPRHNEFL